MAWVFIRCIVPLFLRALFADLDRAEEACWRGPQTADKHGDRVARDASSGFQRQARPRGRRRQVGTVVGTQAREEGSARERRRRRRHGASHRSAVFAAWAGKGDPPSSMPWKALASSPPQKVNKNAATRLYVIMRVFLCVPGDSPGYQRSPCYRYVVLARDISSEKKSIYSFFRIFFESSRIFLSRHNNKKKVLKSSKSEVFSTLLFPPPLYYSQKQKLLR